MSDAALDIAILRAAIAFHESGGPRLDALTGWHAKVIARRISRLIERGFLECGVSERTAWITDEGRDYLRKLEGEAEGR